MGGVINRFQIFILVILLYWFNLIDIYEAIAIIEYINDKIVAEEAREKGFPFYQQII